MKFVFLVLIITACSLSFFTRLYSEKPVYPCFNQNHRMWKTLLKFINSSLCCCRTQHISVCAENPQCLYRYILEIKLSLSHGFAPQFDCEQKAQPLWIALKLWQNMFAVNTYVQESLRRMVLTWSEKKNFNPNTFSMTLSCVISFLHISFQWCLNLWWYQERWCNA